MVTVLFADLVGYSTLAEGQDPERVKRWVDAAFQRLVADVDRFGGSVDKVLGDAVIALFGAPTAHEDDAERAVRAAVRMHETLAEFLVDRAADGAAAVDARLRIGINTGEVLVGAVAGTEYTAMGDVVNIAARLQTMAPPGGVLVGDATRALCSDAVTFEALEPAQLRGREQVEQVWRVVSVDAVDRLRRRRSTTPFVGRRAERTLLGAVGDLVCGGRGATVGVVGEAGIGKSRLVDEFVADLRRSVPDLAVIQGSCPPYGESNPWSPMASGIAAHYGIERGADPATVAKRVRACSSADIGDVGDIGDDGDHGGDDGDHAGVEPGAVTREVDAMLHLLGHPSDLDRLDPAGARDVLFGVVVDLFRRRARRAPLVVWIDDLHWAPAVLTDLLDVVARSTHDVAIMVITASRPVDDADVHPTPDRTVGVQLPLGPLRDVESAELVARMTGGNADPDVVERLTERSGGNPLFLTELVRMAVERDAEDAAHPERTADPGNVPSEVELPGTLRALVSARLDELAPGPRAVLDNAAILGARGPVASLEEFAEAMGQPWDPQALEVLDASGLLEIDDGWWHFRSEVVRDVAYGTLTKQSRAQRHAGVATVMGGYGDLMADEVAHHAARAAELVADLGPVPGVPAGIDSWAIGALNRAARRAYDRGAFRRGVELVERALALAPEEDADARRPLLVSRAEGLVELRRTDVARADLATALAGGDDPMLIGEAERLLGAVEQLDGDLVAAREHLGRAVEIFRAGDDRSRLARALRARGYAEVFGGSLQDAEWYLGEADACYTELGDERGRSWVAQHRAWVAFLSGDHVEAERQLREAAATFDRVGDRSGNTWTNGLLAFVLYFQRRFDEADALASEVAVEARTWGDDWGAAMMLTLTADLRLWSGRFGDALERSERAVAGFRRIGDRFGLLQALTPLNRTRVALGRFEDAERGMEELRAVADSFGALAYPSVAGSGVAMHLGHGERAILLATDAVDRMAETGSNMDDAHVQLALGHLQCGRPDEAMAAIEAVAIDDTPFVRSTRALVLAALGQRDRARDEAAAALATSGASYFDRSLAALAAAASGAPDGDSQLEAALGSGDVVLSAVLREARRRLDGSAAAPVAAVPAGWRRLLDVVLEGAGLGAGAASP